MTPGTARAAGPGTAPATDEPGAAPGAGAGAGAVVGRDLPPAPGPGRRARPRGRRSGAAPSSTHRDVVRLAWAAAVLSAVATAVSYREGWILAYGDAESHLNIAKRVVDGVEPGLAQLGGVWLPLHHLLMLPFIGDDFLWRSGLAGSVVSMAAYVGSVVYAYRLTVELSQRRSGGLLAAAFLGLNPGVLYIQTTAMSEMLLIFTLLASVHHFTRWVRSGSPVQLTAAALYGAAGTLIRYDAWALVLAELAAIVIVAVVRRWSFSRTEGTGVLFGSLALTGIIGWVLWSLVIFGEPAYFVSSQYSARSQQLAFKERGELPAQHDVGVSLLYYGDAAWRNAGTVVTVLAVLGLVVWATWCLRRGLLVRAFWPAALLLVPVVFNLLTLWAGISILFMPDVTPDHFEWSLFNARYGLMAVPAMAVLAALGLTTAVRPLARGAATAVMGAAVAAAAVTGSSGLPVALQDGLVGLSSRQVQPANAYLAEHYDHGYMVSDDMARSAHPIATGLPMERIIWVGDESQYARAVSYPSSIVRWIVVRQTEDDAYWQAVKDNPNFRENYERVHHDGTSAVYKLVGPLDAA